VANQGSSQWANRLVVNIRNLQNKTSQVSHLSVTGEHGYKVKRHAIRLVNRHAARQLGLLVLQLIRVGVLLLRVRAAGLDEVISEALAKVTHADEGIDDGEEDEKDGHDREGRERLPNRHVVVFVAGLVNTD